MKIIIGILLFASLGYLFYCDHFESPIVGRFITISPWFGRTLKLDEKGKSDFTELINKKFNCTIDARNLNDTLAMSLLYDLYDKRFLATALSSHMLYLFDIANTSNKHISNIKIAMPSYQKGFCFPVYDANNERYHPESGVQIFKQDCLIRDIPPRTRYSYIFVASPFNGLGEDQSFHISYDSKEDNIYESVPIGSRNNLFRFILLNMLDITPAQIIAYIVLYSIIIFFIIPQVIYILKNFRKKYIR